MAYGNQNRNGKYNNRGNREQIHLDPIELDYTKHKKLFGDIAQNWAKQLNNESYNAINKSTQIRSFYDKVLGLNEKAEGMQDDEQYKKEVFPFVVMLKSKVAYVKTRGLVSDTFVKMINQCVEEATTIDKMQNFKYFFEAVIGFYPKK